MIEGGLYADANKYIREQLVKTPKDPELQYLYGYSSRLPLGIVFGWYDSRIVDIQLPQQ
jgi:hypothetical protein